MRFQKSWFRIFSNQNSYAFAMSCIRKITNPRFVGFENVQTQCESHLCCTARMNSFFILKRRSQPYIPWILLPFFPFMNWNYFFFFTFPFIFIFWKGTHFQKFVGEQFVFPIYALRVSFFLIRVCHFLFEKGTRFFECHCSSFFKTLHYLSPSYIGIWFFVEFLFWPSYPQNVLKI